ncbi:hypothetical protein MKW92_004022 [Papaver armeniacum]|nr:hypothetical protein MKW92_004022 [Papaver armeniacum]
MSFCEICMEPKAKTKIQENICMITCPEANCDKTLEPYSCRDIISSEVLDRWENALCESSLLARRNFTAHSRTVQ